MPTDVPEHLLTTEESVPSHNEECQRLIAALARSEAQFRSLFACSPDGVFVEDLEGFVLDANPAACEMHGISRESLVGLHISRLVPEGLRAKAVDLQPRLVSGELRMFDSFATKADGTVMPTNIHVTPFDYAGTKAVLLVVRDVTELRRAQEAERQCLMEKAHLARLTMMGEIVAGVAHELNQPLCAINNFASACMSSLELANTDLARVSEWLVRISQQAARASEVIHRMAEFARRTEPRSAVVDLHHALGEAVALIESTTKKHGIEIEFRIDQPQLQVRGDEISIQQTCVNLLTNACAALGAVEGVARRITITTARTSEFAEVTVQDNGPGLPDVAPSKLFEAFFTTRPGGMGLGLAISKGLIEVMGGQLWTDTPSVGGAAFHFTLPLA